MCAEKAEPNKPIKLHSHPLQATLLYILSELPMNAAQLCNSLVNPAHYECNAFMSYILATSNKWIGVLIISLRARSGGGGRTVVSGISFN
jgi:hypothetical protein